MQVLERAQLLLDEVADRVRSELPADAVVFDAHTHLGDDIDGSRARPGEMLDMFDRHGITGSFAFCLDEPDRVPAFTAANNRTLAYAAEHSDRIFPFVRLDLEEQPGRGGDPLPRPRARGIKLHPRAQRFSLGDARLDDVFAVAVEQDVPILIHGGRGLPPIGDHLAALVERYSDVRLIIAHAGIADLGGLAGHFAHVPGVFFDTSLWSVVDLIDLMRQVAPQQILFATDYPYGGLPSALLLSLRAARVSHFDEAELRGMLGTTALAIENGPLPELTAPKGPEALTQPAAAGEDPPVHLEATPLLWMRIPEQGDSVSRSTPPTRRTSTAFPTPI